MGISLLDNFESYPLGETTPFGQWYSSDDAGLYGFATVVQPLTSSIKGSLRSLAVNGASAAINGPPLTKGQIYFHLYLDATYSPNGLPFFVIANLNALAPNKIGADLLSLVVAPDLSVTMQNNTGIFQDAVFTCNCNTGVTNNFHLTTQNWHFFSISFSNFVTSTIPPIWTISAGVTIDDGAASLSGLPQPTGFHTTGPNSVWTGGPNMNGIKLESPLGGTIPNTFFDNIVVGDIGTAFPWEAIPPTPEARVSQLAVEYGTLGLPKARVSQLAVEHLDTGLPKARVSQIVVEIMGQNAFGPSGGWLVKES